jgi:hypothetical protein
MRKSVSLNNVDSEDLKQRTVLPTTEIVIIREPEKIQGKPTPVSEELPDAALQQQQQQQQKEQDQKPGEDSEGKPCKSSIKLKIDTYNRLEQEESSENPPPVTSPGIQPAGEVIDFSTLPKAGVTSLRKRGIVPKMRLMFERARSLEPEAR